jgi:pimeloyl-ACP methyl ester carboxylesterase
MAHFVFVHGASHGAWCWRNVLPRLAALGHTGQAIDLPGHGPNEVPRDDVTLAQYRDAALSAVTPDTILVGHSLGGLTITLAAAHQSDQLRALVYVAAFVPDPGMRFIDFRKEAVSPDVDRVSYREGGLSHVHKDTAAEVFYNDCGPEDRAFALDHLTPQPISVMTERLEFTPPTTPRHYVMCTRDRVVLPAYQTRVSTGWPDNTIHRLETDHSPFFSDPDGLVAALDAIAEQ